MSLSFFLPESKFHCVRNSQLFGASAWTKEYVLNVQDYSKATWTQNFIASISGAVASITVAAPLDTIKTRIQNANFEHKVSGVTVVKDMKVLWPCLKVSHQRFAHFLCTSSSIPLNHLISGK